MMFSFTGIAAMHDAEMHDAVFLPNIRFIGTWILFSAKIRESGDLHDGYLYGK